VTWTGLSGVVAAAVHTICSTANGDSLSAGVDGFTAQRPGLTTWRGGHRERGGFGRDVAGESVRLLARGGSACQQRERVRMAKKPGLTFELVADPDP
jgi:hypothetical protein